jgi:hypothetical protein
MIPIRKTAPPANHPDTKGHSGKAGCADTAIPHVLFPDIPGGAQRGQSLHLPVPQDQRSIQPDHPFLGNALFSRQHDPQGIDGGIHRIRQIQIVGDRLQEKRLFAVTQFLM